MTFYWSKYFEHDQNISQFPFYRIWRKKVGKIVPNVLNKFFWVKKKEFIKLIYFEKTQKIVKNLPTFLEINKSLNILRPSQKIELPVLFVG